MSMSSDPKTRAAQIGEATDHVRAYLREMTELPLEESKRLQTELEHIVGPATPAAPAATGVQSPPPRRRARAKE
jgi:hypothetical protein